MPHIWWHLDFCFSCNYSLAEFLEISLKSLLLPETIRRIVLNRLRRVWWFQRVLCRDNPVCSRTLLNVLFHLVEICQHIISTAFILFCSPYVFHARTYFAHRMILNLPNDRVLFRDPKRTQALLKGLEIPGRSRGSCFYLSSDPAKWRWLFRNQVRLKSLSSTNGYLSTTATF